MSKLLSNGLFYATVTLLGAATISRRGAAIPYGAWTVILGLGLAALAWFVYVDARLDVRIYVVNTTIGLVLAATLYALRKPRRGNIVDYLIVGITVVSLLNFILRPVLIVWDGANYTSYEGFQQSVYWTTVQFASALLTIGVALALMVAIALELIGELQTESRTDKLTGLLNRRGFEDQANKLLQDCIKKGRSVMMVLADLDHFKRINDADGHATGDAVIAAFGATLRAAADSHAVIGRIGGDEFAILLAETQPPAAHLFVDRVRTGFRSSVVEELSSQTQLTASFGMCSHRTGESFADFVRSADEALYTAKRQGRDRATMASVPLMPVQGADGPPASSSSDRRTTRSVA
ncbi:MAG TPA: GGDEF domain-containing protein [Devosia sp.]|nr:GGDEF domain-containing protein [Devosia sp.]